MPDIDNMTLETKDMYGLEIFDKGTWKGREFKDQDIDEMIQNFRDGVIAEPFLSIDHVPAATSQMKDALKAVSLGFVKNLYRMGSKLMADFKKVPKLLAEMIQAGPLKNKSIEVWRKYPHPNGKIFKNVLESVTFTGKIPAVNTLNDFVALFKCETGVERNETQGGEKISLSVENFESQEVTPGMENVTLTKAEYEALVKDQAQLQLMKAEVEKVTFKAQETDKVIDKLRADLVESEKENQSLKDKMKAVEEKEKTMLTAEATSFIDGLIQAGKILPKSKEMYVEQYMTYKASGKLDMFKEDCQARAKIIPTDNFENSSNDMNRIDPNLDPTDLSNYKSPDFESINKKIEAYAKQNKCSFTEAIEKLNLRGGAV